MIRLDDVRNTIIQGSALESLKTFPSACVDEIVTSPPYWPLRSYLPKNHPDKGKEVGGETTLDEYLVHLWQITDELYRILKPTGTMFINFGDSYAGSSQGSWNAPIEIRGKQYRKSLNLDEEYLGGPRRDKTLADRSLCFQNYKFALGLMDIDYRILVEWRVLGKPAGRIEEMMKHPRIQLITRNLLIWKKENAMPFSGTSRFQNTYEPIYFFVKSDTPQYYYNERTKLITKTKPKGKVEGADWEWIKCPYCEGTGKSTINIGRWDKQHDKIYGEDIGNRSRVREGIANADIRYKAGDKPCFRCKTTGRIVRSLWHSEKYFFNLNDIRRPHKVESLERLKYSWDGHREPGSSWEGMDIKKMCHPLGANPGDVMTVATKGSSIGHYATFPEQLISPLIIAGSPDKVCAKCGLPVVQVVELSHPGKTQFQGKYSEQDEIQGGLTTKGSFGRIVGKTHCSCELPEYERAIVLDPFMGSGTTAIVAKKLGRDYIGIDLNDGYVKMSKQRLNQIPESLF